MEIIEFSCVLLDCRKAAWPGTEIGRFQQYVTPQRSRLTPFITELTAITQQMVDPPRGVTFPAALHGFGAFLHGHGLDMHEEGGSAQARVAVVTWGDSDIAEALRRSCEQWKVGIPQLFKSWVNLKKCYRQHFKRDTIGLRRTVERLGLTFDGRAHSGLVDSHNTGKIAIRMMEEGFVFSKGTRAFAPDGNVWGSRQQRAAAAAKRAGEGIVSGGDVVTPPKRLCTVGEAAEPRKQPLSQRRAELDASAAKIGPQTLALQGKGSAPDQPYQLSAEDMKALEQLGEELAAESRQRAKKMLPTNSVL